MLSTRVNHRRPPSSFFSLTQVFEAALFRRRVALTWFDAARDTHRDTGADNGGDPPRVVIGYVLNSVKEAGPYSLKSIARYAVPSVFIGRHWSVVTRVRVVRRYASGGGCGGGGGDCSVREGGVAYEADRWCRVDSEDSSVVELKDDGELLEVLRVVKERGGNVFQAVDESLERISI